MNQVLNFIQANFIVDVFTPTVLLLMLYQCDKFIGTIINKYHIVLIYRIYILSKSYFIV